ncbi:hypothetical protein [Candidatus Leptofilum sp.]|uniref:hypothetical protein n=1 Tax=Candidatus Leptofilum sp. TaxID=3241576 RepID=UPI003B58D2E7
MAFYDAMNDPSTFVISFTANPKRDFGVYAKGYARAASTLAKSLLEKPRFPDYEAYPIVFLYRHAFELYLKGLCYQAGLIAYFKSVEGEDFQYTPTHRLEPLATIFQKICATLFPSDADISQLADKVTKFASEFSQIDKDSFGYRYPTTKSGGNATNRHQMVSLSSFHNSMEELLNELEIITFGFDVEESRLQEIYEAVQNLNAFASE